MFQLLDDQGSQKASPWSCLSKEWEVQRSPQTSANFQNPDDLLAAFPDGLEDGRDRLGCFVWNGAAVTIRQVILDHEIIRIQSSYGGLIYG
jgi:hypothetical protein